MPILFLIFSFIFIFFIFLILNNKDDVFTNIRLSFIKSSIIISLLVVFFTELLSFFKILTSNYIIISWGIVFVVSFLVFAYLIKKNNILLKNLKNNISISFLENKKLIFYFISIIIIILSLFCIALTINNNWDSYTYHLPRVEYWIQNQNVDFYPTNNVRQLCLAPFAEYFILNLKLLSNSNLFNNFVQFFSLINCLLLVSLITKFFDLSKKMQLSSIIISLTIPMALLQSTTTQTDLVVSFFIISSIYFGISFIKNKKLFSWSLLFMSLSLSIGILTKATFYVFALPFCIFFAIYCLKSFKLKSFFILIVLISSFIFVNGSFLLRNYNQFGSPLGPQKTSLFYLPSLNEEFGIKEMLSNNIKNIGLHLALPSTAWNSGIDRIVTKFHKYINFPLNSNITSYFGIEYKTNFLLHHDTVGNFLHIFLFIFSFLIILTKFKSVSREIKIYLFLTILSILSFAFVLKWQPWQTRLDLPIFFLLIPPLVYSLNLIKYRTTINNIICVLLISISIWILFIGDPYKPIFGEKSIFIKNNSTYIFGYNDAQKIELELDKNNISDIGLILGGDSWEWQHWLLSKGRRFEYIYFNKDLVKTPNFNPNFKYRAIILNNNYLENTQIKNIIIDDKNIFGILNISEKETLIIYNSPQNYLIEY